MHGCLWDVEGFPPMDFGFVRSGSGSDRGRAVEGCLDGDMMDFRWNLERRLSRLLALR